MVSVIIPVYNAEKTLESCVQSVLNQTFTEYEIILIDDGSQDKSGQMCDELQGVCEKRNVHCQVIHQENGGVSKARNCGMDHVNGEYFVCIDSDDLVEPCYLEDFVNTIEAHPESGHVICGFRCTSHEHSYILEKADQLSVTDRRAYMRLYDRILIQSPCLGLYRTKIIHEHSIRMQEELSLGEDVLFNLAYLDAIGCAPIFVINKTNYLYRDENEQSMNRRYRADLQTILARIDLSVANYMKKWEITDQRSLQIYYKMIFSHSMRIMENTFHADSVAPMKEKIDYNNTILRSERFREALDKSQVVIPLAQRRALESGNYIRVLFAEYIQKIKERIRKLTQ